MRSEKQSKWHCSGDEKQINNDGRIIKLNINNIIEGSATANAINNNKWMVRLQSFRQVTGLLWCVDRLSDGYLEYASESPYSVQNMANIRIRSIFDSSNTLVNRLGPTVHNTPHVECGLQPIRRRSEEIIGRGSTIPGCSEATNPKHRPTHKSRKRCA